MYLVSGGQQQQQHLPMLTRREATNIETMEIKEGENCKQKTCRKTKNAWTRCKGFAKKTDVLARIQVKEAEKASRMKLFGVQYMDLFEQASSDEVLQRCVNIARSDLDEIQRQIDELRLRQFQIEEKVKRKIQKKPGTIEPPSLRVTSSKAEEEQEGSSTMMFEPARDTTAFGDNMQTEPERVIFDGASDQEEDAYLSPSAPHSTLDTAAAGK